MKYYNKTLEAVSALAWEWTTPWAIYSMTWLESYKTSSSLKKLVKEWIVERKILNDRPWISPANYKSEYRLIIK